MIEIDLDQAAGMLKANDNILVLMHRSPDGDTIGCGYALCAALKKLGKTTAPCCGDDIPEKYGYITQQEFDTNFIPQFIVSVDIASTQLISVELSEYKDKVNLCIDHHGSNTGFAEYGYVDASSGACAQIIKKLIEKLETEIDPYIANALFTGVSTDTGCFRYTNTTPDTHRIAADLLEYGADGAMINRVMFETKTRSQMDLEKMVLQSLRFYENETIAVVYITLEMLEQSGADEGDTEAIPSIPKNIEGVRIGITIKEKGNGVFRISMRTNGELDASTICSRFGGGGHKGAAGCTVNGDIESVTKELINVCSKI